MTPAVVTKQLAPPWDGARYRRVTLELNAGGELSLASHEMGATTEAAWGLDDDERTLVIGPDQVRLLALALVAERLEGEQDAVMALAELCERLGVPVRLACWT
jgi:hypothetical protein